MIINNNVMALNTYNKLSKNNAVLANSNQKLASGLRINKAKDDAAGLSISEKMQGQIRGLEMAERNSQDASSLTIVASGGINEQTKIFQRVRELAIQANDPINTLSDRQVIQDEIDELFGEFDRIARDTEFNTMELLNGTTVKKKDTIFVTSPNGPVVVNGTEGNFIPGGMQNFNKYQNLQLDFTGYTPANLNGQAFELFFLDNNGVEKVQQYLFTDDPSTTPAGFFSVPLKDSAGNYVTTDVLAGNVASAIGSASPQFGSYAGQHGSVVEVSHSRYQLGGNLGIRPSTSTTTIGTTPFVPIAPNNLLNEGLDGAYLNFSSYTTGADIATLDGKAFDITDHQSGMVYSYVFSKNPADTFPPNCKKIDISTTANNADLLTAITASLNDNSHYDTTPTITASVGAGANSGQIYFQHIYNANKSYITSGNNYYSITTSSLLARPQLGSTGLFGANGTNLSGGVNDIPYVDADNPGRPGSKASLTVNLPVPRTSLIGTGFQVVDYAGRVVEVAFVAGAGGITNPGTDGRERLEIGVDSIGALGYLDNLQVTVTGNTMKFEYPSNSTTGNQYKIRDQSTTSTRGTTALTNADSLLFAGINQPFEKPYKTIDLSAFSTAANIQNLAGTAFNIDDIYNDVDKTFEFVNLANPKQLASSVAIDIEGITSLADLVDKLIAVAPDHFQKDPADPDNIRILSNYVGLRGKEEKITGMSTVTPVANTNFATDEKNSNYTIDFDAYVTNFLAAGKVIPDDLIGTGFHITCATCTNEWLNVEFTDGTGAYPDNNNYPVDVTGVTDASSLIDAIIAQIETAGQMTHFTHFKKDGDKLVIYDNRNYDTTLTPNFDPTKIAIASDGIKSDKVKLEVGVEVVKCLDFQVGANTGQTIHLDIPSTRLQQLFFSTYNEAHNNRDLEKRYARKTYFGADDFNVLSFSDAEDMQRFVDFGMGYLSRAQTVLGTTENRLDFIKSSISVAKENLTGAESRIRDVDMSKEVTTSKKAEVMSQAAMSALSYAQNQPSLTMDGILNINK